MKRFSAQYIFTNTGKALKRAVVEAENDGTIISITDTGGDLKETDSVEFYNGIIVPGFVNCHCHLELSHLKNKIGSRQGLGKFINQIRETRVASEEKIMASALSADKEMYLGGIVLCADICNTDLTFTLKKESNIEYFNLIEVFGIDPEKAEKRMKEAVSLVKAAEDLGLSCSVVPHSAYSLSLPLFTLLRNATEKNTVSSVHFMESADETVFLDNHSGSIMDSYTESGLIPPLLQTVKDHTSAILREITSSGNLILVHNTYVTCETIKKLKRRDNLFWCLCPNSNMYIEERIPPADLLTSEECIITIGTDSLASNNRLSILEELKTLQAHFPEISLEEMIRWATLNGAKALGKNDIYGKIEPGSRPGLMLLQNVDLLNLKLLPSSTVKRLL
jgi:cytosine/adenosine deaminase-related metal-dependent hydrolase